MHHFCLFIVCVVYASACFTEFINVLCVSRSQCFFVFLCFCVSVSLSVRPSVCPSVHPPVHPSASRPICLSICSVSLCQSICESICLLVCILSISCSSPTTCRYNHVCLTDPNLESCPRPRIQGCDRGRVGTRQGDGNCAPLGMTICGTISVAMAQHFVVKDNGDLCFVWPWQFLKTMPATCLSKCKRQGLKYSETIRGILGITFAVSWTSETFRSADEALRHQRRNTMTNACITFQRTVVV